MKTITVPVEGLNFASCAQSIEKRLHGFSGVHEVAASYVTQTVTIMFDEQAMSGATIRELVRDCGFACGEVCDPVEMLAEAAASPSATQAPAPSASAVTAAPAHDHVHADAVDHQAEVAGDAMADHAMPHVAEYNAGHDMGHDMSDPAMARAMEADMRRRFWVALVLTIPVVLYSSLGTEVLQAAPAHSLWHQPRNWVLLVLATPVVWWAAGSSTSAPSARCATARST